MRSALSWIAGLSAVFCACSRDRAVIVHVGTDLSIGQLESLSVAASSGAREDSIPSAALGEPVNGIREVSFGVVDPQSGEVELEITGFAAGDPVLQTVHTIRMFGARAPLHVWIFIAAECPEHAAMTTTANDQPSWGPACPDQPPPPPPPAPPEDAGVAEDAQDPPDAEPARDANEAPDGGTLDTGVEAQPEAGSPDREDSGNADAGPNDAGCVAPAGTNRSFHGAGPMQRLELGTDVIFSLPPVTTIETWLRVYAEPAGGVAVLRAELANAPDHWRIDLESSALEIVFTHDRGGTSTRYGAGNLPADHLWHHLALEIRDNAGRTELQWFIDGAPLPALDTSGSWPAETATLRSPSNSGGAQLMLDDLHISSVLRRTSTPGPPPTNVAADASSLGLWKMDEPETAVVAYDSACRNHAGAPNGAFSDEHP